CEICTQQPSKYKCPQCALRYCSLDCYKTHKPTHPEPPPSALTTSSSASEAFKLPPRDRPGTTRRIAKPTFEDFEADPELSRLLRRYPQLKAQLGAVYAMTLEPGVEDMRGWNRVPKEFTANSIGGSGGGGRRGRGRGGRGRGMGRMVERRRWFDAEKEDDRQMGVWTKEKGDKEGLGILRRGRAGGNGRTDEEERAEGFREFVELCQLRFG
ncbi:hypothetical protein K431DRAFT_205900, partial [Polychaeton citri CBS 116435]